MDEDQFWNICEGRLVMGSLWPGGFAMKNVALALIDLVVSLESAPDDVIDPDFEVGLMEDTAAILREMPPTDRKEFVALIAQRSRGETNLVRKSLLSEMPEALGLE